MPPTESQRLAQQQRPSGFPVMKQRWAELGFFHWAFDSELIAARLPKGLHVDTFDGKAWLGIVPFLMQRVRPLGLPPLPWLSWFHELNLRTYVYDDHGNPGVWFFSLDCDQPIAVEIARRLFNLPYQHARMSSALKTGQFRFDSQRKGDLHPSETFRYPRPQNPKSAEFGSLEWFLVERYTLFSADSKGTLHAGRVYHTPYRIETFTEADCPSHLFTLNGFKEPTEPPDSILSTTPVDVTIFPLRKIY
jgi:uncharacterized protein YqjF (DUF2071 family)